MNYTKMLEFHKAHNADATIAVLEVPWEEAPRFGIMSADENDVIYEFAEKMCIRDRYFSSASSISLTF